MSEAAGGSVDLVAAVLGDRLLVLDGTAGPVLPEVVGGEGWPETPLVFRTAGVTTATVIAPPTRLAGEPRTTVHLLGLSVDAPDPDLPGARWLELTGLGRLSHESAVAAAVRAGVAEHAGEVPWPARRPDWYRPGWQDEVDAWVDGELARAGLARSGPSEVTKVWSLSAVLRVPVGSSAVYVKAVCDHFRAEPALTRLLASLTPDAVPQVLATEEDRAWLLMRPFTAGEVERRPETAPAAARALARVQLELVGRDTELLATGAPDRRLGPTLAAFASLVTAEDGCGPGTGADREQAAALLPWLTAELAALAAAGVPDSVGHGDLHIGNYVADGEEEVRLFDWSDAALTCPVLDVQLLAGSAGGEHEQATLEAYTQVWAERCPSADVPTALRHAAVANLAYQVVSYEGIYAGQEEQTRWEMAGASARLLRRLVTRWEEAGRPS